MEPIYLVIRLDTNQITRRGTLSEARELADELTGKTHKPHFVAQVVGRFELAPAPTRWVAVGSDDGETE